MVFRPLAGCGLFPKTTRARISLPGFRPLAGCGLFPRNAHIPDEHSVSVPLRGVGCFSDPLRRQHGARVSVPLRGVGCFAGKGADRVGKRVSVPLRGVGCFRAEDGRPQNKKFPSPCGVWVVSEIWQSRSGFFRSFRPLAGCGLFRFSCDNASGLAAVSVPLRGVGCFSSMMAPRFPHLVSVPLRGVGCFGKAAHSFWCNRKKNCQLCYFIVSYWQMFINSKLRNCKVPCEAHKTAT